MVTKINVEVVREGNIHDQSEQQVKNKNGDLANLVSDFDMLSRRSQLDGLLSQRMMSRQPSKLLQLNNKTDLANKYTSK